MRKRGICLRLELFFCIGFLGCLWCTDHNTYSTDTICPIPSALNQKSKRVRVCFGMSGALKKPPRILTQPRTDISQWSWNIESVSVSSWYPPKKQQWTRRNKPCSWWCKEFMRSLKSVVSWSQSFSYTQNQTTDNSQFNNFDKLNSFALISVYNEEDGRRRWRQRGWKRLEICCISGRQTLPNCFHSIYLCFILWNPFFRPLYDRVIFISFHIKLLNEPISQRYSNRRP